MRSVILRTEEQEGVYKCDHANTNKYKNKKAQIQKITIKVLIMDHG